MGWKIPLAILLLAVLFGYMISRALTPNLISETPDAGDGWWGRGAPGAAAGKEDTSVREFRVDVSEDVLADWRYRVEHTRFVDALEGTAFRYGFNAEYLKQLQQYWLNEYSWREEEERLNSLDQFITNIEGIDVHFIHAKPKLAAGQKAKPIILIHGWPETAFGFDKLIPMLTDPTNHGGSADDVFEVICPNLPGFAFSEAPHKKGFGMKAAARVFHKLMLRLGFKHYYAVGGDWGAAASLNMAIMFPDHVKGLYNHDTAQVTPKFLLYPYIASLWPSYFLPSEEERKAFLPAGERHVFVLQEMAYLYMHSTKPDTVAHGLNDSPMGLAAYTLEKFPTLTNKEWIDLPDGGMSRLGHLDDLLTNVMLHWLSGNVASSLRIAKECMSDEGIGYENTHSSLVPYGYGNFPYEFMQTAKHFLEPFHPNIIHCSYLPVGGHFPSSEVPDVMATDLREFARKVEAL